MSHLRPAAGRVPRRLRVAALLAVVPVVLAACGGGSTASSPTSPAPSGSSAGASASAGAGGTLTIYSGREEGFMAKAVAAFESATGIDAEVRYAGTAALTQQVIEEGDRSPADVFVSQDAGALGLLAKNGRLAPLDASTLAQVDPKYRATDGTWTGFVARARVIAYDPRQVPTPPTSIAQVVDPKYAGKVGYAPTNASFQSFVTAMRVLWGEQRTKDWLTALKAGGAKTYEKNSAVLDAVERGEVALGLINHYYWYEKVNEVGADKVTSKIAFLPGDPGGMVNVAGAGVITSTDQAEAAQKFVAFLLTPAAQAGFVGDESEYPLAKGAPAPKGVPPLASLSPPALDLADLSGLTDTVKMLEDVGIL